MIQKKGRGFPLDYYPGEILTDTQARKNSKMFYLRILVSMNVGGSLAPSASVMLLLPNSY